MIRLLSYIFSAMLRPPQSASRRSMYLHILLQYRKIHGNNPGLYITLVFPHFLIPYSISQTYTKWGQDIFNLGQDIFSILILVVGAFWHM